MPALKGESENAFSGKQKDRVQKETLAASATEVIVERQHKGLLLLQSRRHRMTEEDLRKEVPPGEEIHRKERSKSEQELPQRKVYESVV